MTDAEEKLSELQMLIRLIVNERIPDLDLRQDGEQEAMLAAWERLRDGKSHGIAVHAAKQAAIDVARGNRMTGSKLAGIPITRTIPLTQAGDAGEEYVVEPADISAETAYDEVDEASVLQSLLGPLSDDQNALVRMRLEGLTTREIAPLVGITHQGVSARLTRAYTILRDSLEGR